MGRSSLSKLFDNAVPPWIYVSKALRRPCKSSGSYQNIVLATLQCAHQLETDSFRCEVNTNTSTITTTTNKNNNYKFNKSRGVQYKGDCHLILCKNSSQLQTDSLRIEEEFEEEEGRGPVDAPQSSSSSSSSSTTKSRTSSSNEECLSSTIATNTTTSTSSVTTITASQLATRESRDMDQLPFCSSSSSSLLSYGFSDSSSSGMHSSLPSSEGGPYNLSHLHYNCSSLSQHKPLNHPQLEDEEEEEEEEDGGLNRFCYCHSCPIRGVWRTNPIFQRGIAEESTAALVKYSENPYRDFCSSISEMMAANQMWNQWEQIEEMLECYLHLNAPHHHGLIKLAFLDVLTHMATLNPLELAN